MVVIPWGIAERPAVYVAIEELPSFSNGTVDESWAVLFIPT